MLLSRLSQRRLAGALLLLTLMLGVPPASAASDDLVIVVHPSRKFGFDQKTLARIYLKQRRFWSNGDPIIAVNREAGTREREKFALHVFDAGSASFVSYWNRQYFQGVLPPATLSSNEAILRFVAEEPRAIGYVPADLVDDRVRVVHRFRKSSRRQN